jgi:hypothetical protein
LIGQAPGPKTDPDLPLYPLPRTSAGGRLKKLTGLTTGQYLKAFDRVNLLHKFPGRTGTDDKFPMPPARVAAMAIRPLLAGRHVVLLGTGVARAFDLDIEVLTWHKLHCGRGPAWPLRWASVAVLPHTSGRSRWYNCEENVARARQFLADLIGNSACLSSGEAA